MKARHFTLLAALTVCASAAFADPLVSSIESDSTDPLRGKAVVADRAGGAFAILDARTLDVRSLDGPTNASGVVVNAVTGVAYVADSTAPGAVLAIDVGSGETLRRSAVGNRPSDIAADFPRGELYVANRDDATVSIVHAATLKVIETIAVSGNPSALAVDPRRGYVYALSAAQGSIDVIDVEYRQLAATVAVGRNPRAAAVDEVSGKVYVNNVDDRTVSVVDPASFQVTRTIPTGAGSTVGIVSPVQRRFYLPSADDGRLSVIDTRDDRIVAFMPVMPAAQKALLSPDEDEVFVLDGTGATVVDVSTAAVKRHLSGNEWVQLVAAHAPDSGATRRFRLKHASAAESSTADTALATEYVDDSGTRYMHTADPLHARLVADGLYGDRWRRTLRFFRVWTTAAEGRVPVCRLASDGRGDVLIGVHEECAAIEPARIAYFVATPEPDGSCGSGTEPLFRLRGPDSEGLHYRYFTSAGVRDTLAAAGWVPAGSDSGSTVACVPALKATTSVTEAADAPRPRSSPNVRLQLHPR